MRVLVTGVAGRLGRTVARQLSEVGHEVVGADLQTVPDLPIEQVQVDLTTDSSARTLMSEIRPDAVVHLAAIAVPFSAPEEVIFRTNTQMAFAVISAAVASGVPRVLVASSPTVLGYGREGWTAASLPLDEDHPRHPGDAYALSKVVTEDIVRMFARSGVASRLGIIRPCYVIAPEEWEGGPTQQGHSVVERLNDPTLAAASLFNYVDARDVADFIALWLEADDLRQADTFFLAASDALALTPVAELWREHAPGLGVLADSLVGNESVFSIEKAGRVVGWAPKRLWRLCATLPESFASEVA